MDLPFCVKSSLRASSTRLQELIWSYNITTYRSIIGICSFKVSSVEGVLPKSANTFTTSGYIFSASQEVFFPLSMKNEVLSQPLRAWNISRDAAFSGSSARAISWAGMYLKFFPVPNASQSSLRFMWENNATDIIRISVSTVCSITFGQPFTAVSAAGSSSLVLTSSWCRERADWRHLYWNSARPVCPM